MADEKITTSENDENEALFQQVMTCEPAITMGVVNDIERMFASQSFGVTRRATLMLSTKGGEFYKKMSEDRETAVTIASVALAAEDHVERLRALADLMEQAVWRTKIALCAHEDMQVIETEAAGRLEAY